MVRFLLEASGKNTETTWSFDPALGLGVPQFQSCVVLEKALDLTKLWSDHLQVSIATSPCRIGVKIREFL